MNNPPLDDDDRYDALLRDMRAARAARSFLLFLGAVGAVSFGFLLAPSIGQLF